LFVCYRTLTAAETARLCPVALPLPVTIWTGDDYLAKSALSGWTRDSRAVEVQWIQDDRTTSPETTRGAGVLHVIGALNDTSAGIVLSLAPTAGTRSSPRTSTGPVLYAEAILDREPATQLCIVQAFLDEDPAQRTDLRRREAALLRRFAAGVFKTGVPAVLALPPLTEELNDKVLALLSAALTDRRHRGTQKWLHTLRNMQQEIAATIFSASSKSEQTTVQSPASSSAVWPIENSPASDAALEVAFDVCLYLVDDFLWDLQPAPLAPEKPSVPA
jgi:hypothetical protein